MKIAIPVWGHYVSTVFDFCDCLLVIDFKSGQIKDRETVHFADNSIAGKPTRLRELGIRVLLCGAISVPLYRMIEASGITIIPFLRGTADEILDAYLSGSLLDGRFMLPGFNPAGWHRKGRGMRHQNLPRGRRNMKKGW